MGLCLLSPFGGAGLVRPLAAFSEQLAALLQGVGAAGLPADLVRLLRTLVPIDDATVLHYPVNSLPVAEYFELKSDGSSNLDLYIRGAFLLDPYYQAFENHGKSGFFRLRELTPSGFLDSEYFRTFYQLSNYQDECGYVAPAGTGFIHISLARTGESSAFSDQEVELLGDVRPVIEQVCELHWSGAEAPAPGSKDLRGQLHSALTAFGSSVLTEREAEVINLVLHGHSTRTVAEKLSISMETVKLHRKHAYSKLEIGSQAELFYLFLDSLMSAGDYQGGDTLERYLQPPPRH